MTEAHKDMRDIIIEKSSIFFARHGLSKTTIDDIARSMRMGKSSLYYYFKGKEDIYKAVLDREIALLSQKIVAALAACPTPQEKLRVFGCMRMQYLKELSNVYRALKDDYLSHHAFIRTMRAEYDARESALVRAILEEGMRRGDFAMEDPALTAHAVITALRGLEYEWSLEGNDIDIGRGIDALLNILLNGISKK